MTQPDVRREADPAEQAWVQETDPSVKFSSTCKGPYMIGFDRGYRAGVEASPDATNERIILLLDQAAEQRREFKAYRAMAAETEKRLTALVEDRQRALEGSTAMGFRDGYQAGVAALQRAGVAASPSEEAVLALADELLREASWTRPQTWVAKYSRYLALRTTKEGGND